MSELEKVSFPLVSVVMCTFNNANYLNEAIDSILNQSYQNFELIIINDGSTDNTKEIILNYDSSKVRYYEHQKNLGQEKAKNRGLIEAKGKYIAYMDGDDISEKERLEIQVAYLEANPTIGFCSTGVTFFGQRGGHYLSAETDEQIRIDGMFSTPVAHATMMIRGSVLREHCIQYVQGYLATEDYWFILQLLKKTKAYSIQKPLYRYRWHGHNISVKKASIQKQNFKKISYIAFQQLLKIDLSEAHHDLVYSIFRGEITLKKLNKIHPIIKKYLQASDTSLVEAFWRHYAECVVKIYYKKALNLLSS